MFEIAKKILADIIMVCVEATLLKIHRQRYEKENEILLWKLFG